MEKRACKRISVRVNVKFFLGSLVCSGTVTNLSENGMFISADKTRFPFGSQFPILIHFKDEVLTFPVKMSRLVKTNGIYDGMGVELLIKPKKYLELLDKLRPVY